MLQGSTTDWTPKFTSSPRPTDAQPRDMSVSSEDAPLPPPPNPDIQDLSDFAHFVLGLSDEASELATFDARLVAHAHNLGIPVPPFVSTPTPHSLAQVGRTSSSDSQFSVSSSRFSPEPSTGWDRTSIGLSAFQPSNRLSSFTSTSSRSRDSILSQPLPITNPVTTISFPRTPLLPPSENKIGAYLPDNPFKPASPHRHLIRGLSRLRLRRQNSDKHQGCSHCSSSSKHSEIVLPCGHGHCDTSIRELVGVTDTEGPTSWPSCCGRPLSDRIVHSVREAEGQSILGSPSSNLSRSSLTSQVSSGAAAAKLEQDENRAQNHVVLAQSNLLKALTVPEYRNLRSSHCEQRDRFLRWNSKHRAELIATAVRRKREALEKHGQLNDAMVQKHTTTIADVEDKHIAAEAEIRSAHEVERRNNNTALRHMEAYCRGQSSNGEPHNRVISEQDRRELANTRRMRDNMHIRQQSAINVLRGEQSLRLQARLGRQENELQQLQHQYEREVEITQRELDFALENWGAQSQYYKATLERWWWIETRICLKEHGDAIDLPADALLTPLPWIKPPSSSEESPEGPEGRVDSVVPD
ncbi:hypothetical protein K461DRAFT_40176 [Myriangium duriaei CBS 260.36]|uniref:Uncharacterized protein n=1 Tax=Myriangium duriaei CBS 260.36 TaxID=1168546 RepID=A0A9P4IUA9_9PEZI|nr:hypothetical protein K461DRAFT_40176 [Myriangium duriaei CBS 260.36]